MHRNDILQNMLIKYDTGTFFMHRDDADEIRHVHSLARYISMHRNDTLLYRHDEANI